MRKLHDAGQDRSRHHRSEPGNARSTARVAIVSGTRPEIIKLAPVWRRLREQARLRVTWIHTGQHGQMADEMFECFGIEPDSRLERSGAQLEQFSADCRQGLDRLMAAQAFDMCVVQGDTESAFLGALSAFYHRIPVAHVEAGLRTYRLERPFPEEGLRQMISRIAALHFAPTARAVRSLRDEGIAPERIVLTGNTVVDAQRWAMQRHRIARRTSSFGHVLVTVHRREHWGAEMQAIFGAVAQLARERPHLPILFPVHLNPVVQSAARACLEGLPNVQLVPPLGYVALQQALADAALVLTDSGGIQEEAPTHGVPVLVLRHETERPEGVEAGCAFLVGPKPLAILHESRRQLDRQAQAGTEGSPSNPYGDGYAADRIAGCIAERLQLPARARAHGTRRLAGPAGLAQLHQISTMPPEP